jgi:hypothetical protein
MARSEQTEGIMASKKNAATAATQAEVSSRAIPVGPRLMRVLAADYRAGRSALLEGPSGIGKSQIIEQLTAELGIGFRVLMLSLLENVDLQGMPYIDEEKRTLCAVPKEMPGDGQGVLLLEELNRAERHVQQAAMELSLTGRTRQYTLPPGWVVFAAINPEGDDYFVTALDPAHRARFHNIKVRADVGCWLAWAEKHGVHPVILRLAREHRGVFDSVPPRTWTLISSVLCKLSPAERQDLVLLHDLLTDLPSAWAELVIEGLQGPQEVIDGLEVRRLLTDYHKSQELRNRLRAVRDAGRLDVVEKVAGEVLQRIDGGGLNQLIDSGEFHLSAFEALINDLPGDYRELLQGTLGDNPAAATQLAVRPDELLRGDYPRSPACLEVSAWCKDPARSHRVQVLVKSLVRYLEKHPNIYQLRTTNGAMIGLGMFSRQVDDTPWKSLLDSVFVKLNIRPVLVEKR